MVISTRLYHLFSTAHIQVFLTLLNSVQLSTRIDQFLSQSVSDFGSSCLTCLQASSLRAKVRESHFTRAFQKSLKIKTLCLQSLQLYQSRTKAFPLKILVGPCQASLLKALKQILVANRLSIFKKQGLFHLSPLGSRYVDNFFLFSPQYFWCFIELFDSNLIIS